MIYIYTHDTYIYIYIYTHTYAYNINSHAGRSKRVSGAVPCRWVLRGFLDDTGVGVYNHQKGFAVYPLASLILKWVFY